MYRQIDPVFPPNYFRLAQVYIMEQRYDDAIKTYESLIDAVECGVNPKLLAKDSLRNTILSYQAYIQEDGKWVHRHAMPATHEGSEAYTSLANAHYLAEQNSPGKDVAGHLVAAELYYKKALAYDPAFANAKSNLEIVYRKAQTEGRLRKLNPPARMPVPGEPPFTGYEVAPIKG
jgi:tetratricopeptide (TPR) repeat protein